MRARAPGLVGLSLLLAASAQAWPVDVQVELAVGGEQFKKPAALAWAEVEDPKVARAEVLETGELFLTGVSPGRTLLLLYAEGKLAVWRLRVGQKALDPKVPGWKECPGLEARGGRLEGAIADDACRRAVLAFLEKTDAFTAHDLSLTFSVPALQGQLRQLEENLRGAPVKASYRGAGLRLEGDLSALEHRRVLWQVFRSSLGRVALDDKLVVPPSPSPSSPSSSSSDGGPLP